MKNHLNGSGSLLGFWTSKNGSPDAIESGAGEVSLWRKAAVRDGHLRIDLAVWNPCVTQCVRKERKDLWHNPDRDGPVPYCEGGIEFPHTLCFCDRFGSAIQSYQRSAVQ